MPTKSLERLMFVQGGLCFFCKQPSPSMLCSVACHSKRSFRWCSIRKGSSSARIVAARPSYRLGLMTRRANSLFRQSRQPIDSPWSSPTSSSAAHRGRERSRRSRVRSLLYFQRAFLRLTWPLSFSSCRRAARSHSQRTRFPMRPDKRASVSALCRDGQEAAHFGLPWP